jgi:uncharacterized protein (DUF4415 family)
VPYRSDRLKRRVTLCLDADLRSGFRKQGPYQTRINDALRDHDLRHLREEPAE